MFDDLLDLTNVPSTPVADELTAYLQENRKKVQDVIGWWEGKCNLYPRLSQMALDYQCIPGKY
jgi:hypothetical protein